MATNTNANGVAAAIVFAGLAISAGLVFIGLQFADGGMVGADKPAKEVAADDNKEVKAEVKEGNAGGDDELPRDSVAENVRKVDADYDHIRGDKDARITIVEYSDYDCPFCTRVHPTIKEVVEEYDGKVNWVYRHFPLSFHEPSASAKAEAAECVADVAGNDAFWAYSDALYEGKATGDTTSLVKLAADLKVDKAKFQECIDSDKFDDRIAQDIDEGAQAGVTGTPGNIILDNKTGRAISVVGAQPKQNFKKVIDVMLEL